MKVEWIAVKKRLPPYSGDFVWAYSQSCGVVLAYYTGYPGAVYWQTADTAGDSEGLSVEYYSDVTHWAVLEEPDVPSITIDMEKEN
jgi:hypothetical protein